MNITNQQKKILLKYTLKEIAKIERKNHKGECVNKINALYDLEFKLR